MLNIKCFVFNPICVNTFVIYNESKECIIVDPGNHNIGEDNILFDYIEKNQLKPIMILNTHGHIDHILGNYSTAMKYDIPLASHPDGVMYYKSAASYASAFGINYKKEETLYPTIELFNNQIINIGVDELEVIFRRGIGRTDLPGGSYKEIVESLENKLFQLPDDTTCYCGHGPETTIGEERFH